MNLWFKLSWGYPDYTIQQWYIWNRFKTPGKRFHKLQETIWPTVTNKIFEFSQLIDPFSNELFVWRFLGLCRVPNTKIMHFWLDSKLLVRDLAKYSMGICEIVCLNFPFKKTVFGRSTLAPKGTEGNYPL